MSLYFLIQEALREERDERKRLREVLRSQLNINSIPDTEFIKNYRLSRNIFDNLCAELVPLLPRKRQHNAISGHQKILCALNFYARGSYQGNVGLSSDVPMAQQTVSRCLKEVTDALNHPTITSRYIRFPQNLQERDVIKRQFYHKYGLPGVVGCIDCSHIAIVRPNENEERYFNRKNYHSLNAQVICDAECNILNVDASYGGATHDSFIWSNHELKTHLENLQDETAYLLGDSGYPLREYLMTSIENAIEDSPEGQYNTIQKRARSTIERTFGILKCRWRCLLAARELHYSPDTAGKIMIACCILHNICNQARLEAPPLTDEEVEEERERQERAVAAHNPQPMRAAQQDLQRGQRTRERLVQLLDRNRG